MLLKFEKADEFRTADDILLGFQQVQKELEAIRKAAGSGVPDPEKMANVEKQLSDVLAGQKALEEKVKASNPDVLWNADVKGRIAGLTLPFKTDREFSNVSREQWNVVAYRSDELSFAANLRNLYPGLHPNVERIVRRERTALDDLLYEVQGLNDALYLLDTMLLFMDKSYAARGPMPLDRMRTLSMWPEYEKRVTQLRTGMSSGGTGTGAEWVPTFFSAQMHDMVQLNLVVASLFPTIDMPHSPYQSPVLKADGLAYYVAEQTTGAARAGTGAAAVIPESNPTTGNMTLTARKLAARMWTTTEAVEEVVVPVIPFLLGQLAKVVARGKDDAILNGDRATNHIDYQAAADAVTGAQDRRKSIYGLRALAIRNSLTVQDFSTPTIPTLLSVRSAMGTYGQFPTDLPIITSLKGMLLNLYAITDGTAKALITVDKYGPGAIVLTGEAGKLAGHSIVCSEFIPLDSDVTGIRPASAGTYTQAIIPHVPSFVLGNRRGLTIARSAELGIEWDQLVFVATHRFDFQPWWAQVAGTVTEKCVSLLTKM